MLLLLTPPCCLRHAAIYRAPLLPALRHADALMPLMPLRFAILPCLMPLGDARERADAAAMMPMPFAITPLLDYCLMLLMRLPLLR